MFLLFFLLFVVNSKLNVLFLAADDLRPQLPGHYGQNYIKAPNFQKLMSESITFTKAYCQVPLCSPSRTSLLTGLRPDTTGVYDIGPYFRNTTVTKGTFGDSIITLPQYFKKNGYKVTGAGKIFHQGTSSGGFINNLGGGDMPFSWSDDYWFCDQYYNGSFQSPKAAGIGGNGCVMSDECFKCQTEQGLLTKGSKGYSWKNSSCDDNCFPDGAVADEVISQLTRASTEKDQPFFIAGGLKRPHLTWYGTDEKFNLYDVKKVNISEHPFPPPGMPQIAFTGNGEISGMYDVEDILDETSGYRLVPLWKHQELRRAYYGVTSFIDEQLGKIIQALKYLKLYENTIIVFWGDHGYHLGEQGMWAKLSLFENSLRVPLIFSIPNYRSGQKSEELVELLDVFPTLVDFAGLNPLDQIEGKSLRPQIENPNLIDPQKTVQSQVHRGGNVLGVSMRTHKYRYTEWLDFNVNKPMWNTTFAFELYDHKNDHGQSFDNFEISNLAIDSIEHLEIARNMSKLLHKNWDKIL